MGIIQCIYETNWKYTCSFFVSKVSVSVGTWTATTNSWFSAPSSSTFCIARILNIPSTQTLDLLHVPFSYTGAATISTFNNFSHWLMRRLYNTSTFMRRLYNTRSLEPHTAISHSLWWLTHTSTSWHLTSLWYQIREHKMQNKQKTHILNFTLPINDFIHGDEGSQF